MEDPLPEWLREFRNPPPSWEPPDELRDPTPSPALNLALLMLASEVVGNDLIELIGSWISVMARLNIWFKGTVQGRLPRGAYAELFVLQGKVAEAVYGSWNSYREALGDPPTEGAEQEYDALMKAVREGVARINDFMASHS